MQLGNRRRAGWALDGDLSSPSGDGPASRRLEVVRTSDATLRVQLSIEPLGEVAKTGRGPPQLLILGHQATDLLTITAQLVIFRHGSLSRRPQTLHFGGSPEQQLFAGWSRVPGRLARDVA